MADRKETPDILGGLLGDKKPKAPQEKNEKEEAKKPAYHNTGMPEYHKDSKTVKQQARKPSKQPASKPAGQKPQRTDKADEEATSDSGEVSGEKLKATYYLAIEVVDALEEGWYQLRRMASTDNRTSISKSLIVETALQITLEELNTSGQKSRIAKRLLEK
jgi:hypothetical protein